MKIRMELLSDAIFGNGASIPGAEDISAQNDEFGFPYYKGSTFKGVLREEYERYLEWINCNDIEGEITRLFGKSGNDLKTGGFIFSDFVLSPYVKKAILDEIGHNNREEVLETLSNIRMFTSITDEGVAQKGSLRMARCVDKGLSFYGEVKCSKEDEARLEEVIKSIKWIGSMRNRGFGKVRLSKEMWADEIF